MTSRAVLLSASGDPFLPLFVLKLFQERWYGEVDRFYINYNNYADVPLNVVQEFLSRAVADPKVTLIYHPHAIGAGTAIAELLKICTEDNVLLLEEDGFIFTPGIVDGYFKQIESGEVDALGSPRMSCGTEIAEALRVKYNLDYSGYGDVGPNFWPNFFFCKREDLLETDLNFDARGFKKDVYYKELDHTMQNEEAGDTFVSASIQLRYLGLKFKEIPQFHASPFEIIDQVSGDRNWRAETPFWLHAGSLSVGSGKYLNNVVPDVAADINKQEIETRTAFWTIVSSLIDGFKDYKYVYQKGIESLIANAALDRDRIGKKIGIYRTLMKI